MTASYGYYGGAIGDLLNQWAQMGFFSYLLPFLLIFAVVFGILSSIKIFEKNRGVDAIIALTVGLLALQFDAVPVFFSQIFPRLGIALAVILTIVILAGFFVDTKNAGIMYTLLGIGIVASLIVIVTSFSNFGFSSIFFREHMTLIFTIVFVLAALGIIVGTTSKEKTEYKLGTFERSS